MCDNPSGCEDATASMSRTRADGIRRARYSLAALRGELGMCHDASITTRSESEEDAFRLCSWAGVITSGHLSPYIVEYNLVAVL